MDLGEEPARDAAEGDEDVANLLREQGRSGRSECQCLQAVNDRCAVPMTAGVLDVVMDRMVVGRDCLERRRLDVGKGPAWRPEGVSGPDILECLGVDDREGVCPEELRGWLNLKFERLGPA